MMADDPQTLKLAQPIENRLGRLRWLIRGYLWLDGTARLVIALAIAFWLSLSIDWLFEPSRAVRIGLLISLAPVVGCGAWVSRQMARRGRRLPLRARSCLDAQATRSRWTFTCRGLNPKVWKSSSIPIRSPFAARERPRDRTHGDDSIPGCRPVCRFVAWSGSLMAGGSRRNAASSSPQT